MKGAWFWGSAVLLFSVVTSLATAQTVTSSWPPILDQVSGRPLVRINIDDDPDDNIADGVAFRITNDAYDVSHQGSWTFEFDGSVNDGVVVEVPARIEIDVPTDNIIDAFEALETEVNVTNPANYPFFMKYQYGGDVPENGWFIVIWKYDGEYALSGGPPNGPSIVELTDTEDDIAIAGNFSTTDPERYTNTANGTMSYLRLEGTDLNLLANLTSVKLRHDVNTTEVLDGRVILKYTTNAIVRFNQINGFGIPPVYPSLGQYDLEINGTIVIDKAVTLVENLLDDKTFRIHASGGQLPVAFNGINELLLSPYWLTVQGAGPDTDGVRRGSVNEPTSPRIYPFPTGPVGASNNGLYDNEYGSLQWDTDDGVHKFYQTIYVNFLADTTLKLTGYWSATGDNKPLNFGAQLRSGDENGTIIAETPPGQLAINPFGWTDLSLSGVFPNGTTQVTVVFYGDHPNPTAKSLHLDDLILYVDPTNPTPAAIDGMTTDNYATVGTNPATITLTGANLTNGLTSVTLQQPDVMVRDLMTWADAGKELNDLDSDSFAAYTFHPGDQIVLTGGSNVILGTYDIASKENDRTIKLVNDINGVNGDEGESISGYIVKAPLAAATVNATGTQVTATFDLTGAPAGYRNIIVQVDTQDPIVWREAFNVIYPGPSIVNGSFESPAAPVTCIAGVRQNVETFTPATDWTIRFWGNHMDEVQPHLNFRDDYWSLGPPSNPSCPPDGDHYASSLSYIHEGTIQWSQTIATTPATTYILSGWFAHSDQGDDETEITLSLLDGDSTADPMTGASTVVVPADTGGNSDWAFGSVTGTTTGSVLTVSVEIRNVGDNPGPRAAWIDQLVLVPDLPPLVSAVSRRTHGGAGAFDIPLIPNGAAVPEPRQNGTTPQTVFTYTAAPTNPGCGGLTVINGTCNGTSVVGNDIVVDMTFDTNACVTVALGLDSVQVHALEGDSTMNGKVTSADVNLTKANAGATVIANFDLDVNVDGVVDNTDTNIVKGATSGIVASCP